MKLISFGTEARRREEGFLLGDNPPTSTTQKPEQGKALATAVTGALLFAVAAVYSYSRKVK